jgi:hypothetical protein
MRSFDAVWDKRLRVWAGLMALYCATSLLHFAHNATYLDDYPNLPAWLSAAGVYAVWLAESAVGVIAYVLVRMNRIITGLIVSAIYAMFGFDGLGHYVLAPMAAHTAVMNATIWAEVIAAMLLLIAIITAVVHAIASRKQMRAQNFR